MQQYFDRLREDQNFKVRDSNWKLMSMETREHFFSKVDTVVTFDPESYEETVTIVQNSLHAEDMMQLRLVQDWLWDERKRFPIFLLYAFAPMENVKDQEGNLRFKRPLFWRMVRD